MVTGCTHAAPAATRETSAPNAVATSPRSAPRTTTAPALPAARAARQAAPAADRSSTARDRSCGRDSSSEARTAELPAPTTALVVIWAGSPVSSPKVSQDALSATASQQAVGDRPRVRRCRQDSQTWGQTREMDRAAAAKPRAAIMVERVPFGRGQEHGHRPDTRNRRRRAERAPKGDRIAHRPGTEVTEWNRLYSNCDVVHDPANAGPPGGRATDRGPLSPAWRGGLRVTDHEVVRRAAAWSSGGPGSASNPRSPAARTAAARSE